MAQHVLSLQLSRIPKLNLQNDAPKILLERYEKEGFQVVESITMERLDTIQSFSFKIPKNTPAGLFSICILEKSDKSVNKAEFIWSSTDTVRLQAQFFQLKNGSLEIEKSKENEAYFQMLSIKQEFEPLLEKALQAREAISMFRADFKRKITEMELETEKVQLAYDNKLATLAELFPGTFTAKYLIPLSLVPVRSVKTAWADQFDSYLSFLHQFYFTHTSFAQENYFYHYAFSDKIFYYLTHFTAKTSDGLKSGVDVIFRQFKDNESVNSFVFNILLKSFIKTNNESLTKYVMDKHGSDCSLNLGFEELKKLQAIQALSIGGLAPEISLPDLQGNYHSLRAYCQKNNLTIVFFWISWCGRCQKETPKLIETYKKYKNKGLSVFSVSLDEKKEDWTAALTKYGSPWINVSELVPITKSQILPSYNISTTPAMFILDKSGKVLAKNLYGNSLETFLQENLK